METELKVLRAMVKSVLPKSLELEDIDVVAGSPMEGQPAIFKAVIQVRQSYDDPMGTVGWVSELSRRVRVVWGRDELCVKVIEKANGG